MTQRIHKKHTCIQSCFIWNEKIISGKHLILTVHSAYLLTNNYVVIKNLLHIICKDSHCGCGRCRGRQAADGHVGDNVVIVCV